jgi:RimJ/RimL family protein N-acetyltransferase
MNFEFQPLLESEKIFVRPMAADDFDALFEVASDPKLWVQHPARNRYQHGIFRSFFDEAMSSGSAFVIIDRQNDETIGSSRYSNLDVSASEVEIGWTFIARSHWSGGTNAEVKRLMLEHAFRFVDTVIFWVGETNFRSRRAVEKLGARLRNDGLDRAGCPHVVYALDKSRYEH